MLDLDSPDTEGNTKRMHLESIEKKYGRRDPALDTKIEVQEEGMRAFETFLSLNTGRTGNGFGPNAISFTEIKAWCDLYETKLMPWEVQAIKSLDNLYLETMNKK